MSIPGTASTDGAVTSGQPHTRGPWHWNGDVYIWGESGDGVTTSSVATIHAKSAPGQHDANARLIAEAPALLGIAQRWAALDGGAWHVERHAREKAELLAETRALIAKATGAA